LQGLGLFNAFKNATALEAFEHTRPPFAVFAVKQGHIITRTKAHNAKQVMRLFA
jgi:hypothetical protein